MKAWIGAALIAVACAAPGHRGAQAAPAATPGVRTAAAAATEFSSRHRVHRHARRHPHAPPYRRYYIYAPRGYDYYARPYWYRPDGVAPFFPFGFGYGLGPSW